MVERMDRISEEIGQALTGRVEGDGSVHCPRCNSRVEIRNLMLRDWSWKPGAACPNCGSQVDLGQQQIVEEATASVATAPGEERQCRSCGGAYQSMVIDPRSGEARPSRYCPHCGHSLQS